MKITKTIEEYLAIGGRLCDLDWWKVVCNYTITYRNWKIKSYDDLGEFNSDGEKLIYITFDNGKQRRCNVR